ncbi:unnamed protein product [Linum tenue]|uniref:Lipocalin/cytosolic fatty-acid binding domain-containing protein n=1 Tax=Linum tenue TaxID=586396 RepID=A0AAV0I2R7_9ROSI|nr:unnamed protein product [Linum tenue]
MGLVGGAGRVVGVLVGADLGEVGVADPDCAAEDEDGDEAAEDGDLDVVEGLVVDREANGSGEEPRRPPVHGPVVRDRLVPALFQPKKGENTRATYTLKEDGATVGVLNETWSDRKRSFIEGIAYKADPESDEAKLKVKLKVPPILPVFPVTGDYWVLYIDPEYQHTLIDQPSRKYL